jgi:hypothetical protein
MAYPTKVECNFSSLIPPTKGYSDTHTKPDRSTTNDESRGVFPLCLTQHLVPGFRDEEPGREDIYQHPEVLRIRLDRHLSIE